MTKLVGVDFQPTCFCAMAQNKQEDDVDHWPCRVRLCSVVISMQQGVATLSSVVEPIYEKIYMLKGKPVPIFGVMDHDRHSVYP